MFKGLAIAIGVLFWCGSSFFAQLDYISMFVTIFTSLWVAGAGAVVTLGLYWRRGTTAGAYAAIISGGGISLAAILIQRNWASAVYPWLAAHGWEAGVRHLLEVASSPFVPWIDWRVTDALWPVKFPINSIEISFIAGMTAFLLYVVISLLTCKEPFDLDLMLHRKHQVEVDNEGAPDGAMKGAPLAQMKCGAERQMKCASQMKDNSSLPPKVAPSFARRLLNSLVGITPEFTREDRIIAWLGFFKHMVWEWIVAFLLCSIAAKIFHWGVREWATRCFIVVLVVPITINVVTTVWFTWGTIRDLKRLFHDLAERRRNDLDNGMVEGHVSLADKESN
jgi:hypothetical protein